MIKKYLIIAISAVIILSSALLIFSHLRTDQPQTYQHALLTTTVTENDDYHSLYVDVVHEASNLNLFIKSQKRSVRGFYGFEQTNKRFDHDYLFITYAYDLPNSGDSYILSESYELEIIYELHTFSLTNIGPFISNYEILNVEEKKVFSVEFTDYFLHNLCDVNYEEDINCAGWKIDLKSWFDQDETFKIKRLEQFNKNQMTIPLITGYRITYTAKLNTIYLEQSNLGPHNLTRIFGHGFSTNLGYITKTETFDF